MLKEEDRERIINFYKRSFTRNSENFGRVSWTSRKDQILRFMVLSSIGDLRGRPILDVGSGLGDFYFFLNQEVGNVRYTGIDIVPDFVAYASDRFPEVKFLERNIMDMPEDQRFDYVLSSGALTFKVEDNEDFYFSVIEKMFRLSRIGTGFNMLNLAHHSDDQIYAAYDPKRIASLCENLTSKMEVRTDYMPEDFTVFLYH